MRLLQFRTIVYARIYGCLSVARLHECFYSGIKRPRRVTRPCSILDFGWRIWGHNVEPPATAGGTDRKRTTSSATYKTCGCHPSFVRRGAKRLETRAERKASSPNEAFFRPNSANNLTFVGHVCIPIPM